MDLARLLPPYAVTSNTRAILLPAHKAAPIAEVRKTQKNEEGRRSENENSMREKVLFPSETLLSFLLLLFLLQISLSKEVWKSDWQKSVASFFHSGNLHRIDLPHLESYLVFTDSPSGKMI